MARGLIVIVIGLHAGFLILEMFLWTKPLGRRIFGQTAERAQATRVLAANQGLYNGIVVAGLAWALLHPDPVIGRQLSVFFLSCIIVAGIFGAATVSRRILYVQAMPAITALWCLLNG